MPEKKIMAYKKRLDELLKFKSITSEELCKKSEIVMIRDHICNVNLKIDTLQKKDLYLSWKHPDPKKKKSSRLEIFKMLNYEHSNN